MGGREVTTLIFLSLVFRQKPRKTTPNTKDLLPPRNPRKPLEKQRKTTENTQNTKEFPWLEKTKEKQNTQGKEDQGRW